MTCLFRHQLELCVTLLITLLVNTNYPQEKGVVGIASIVYTDTSPPYLMIGYSRDILRLLPKTK